MFSIKHTDNIVVSIAPVSSSVRRCYTELLFTHTIRIAEIIVS
uniref:Uncharacterized protein n=1 Tax=virus sp. ctBM815 TaxID=2825806 RepID=A0A8S5RK87_9VIRU|nr:MAG TPA: hypothetical protein [virus sp. ctBM815]